MVNIFNPHLSWLHHYGTMFWSWWLTSFIHRPSLSFPPPRRPGDEASDSWTAAMTLIKQERTQRYEFEFDSYGHILFSFVDRAPHKVLLLAILQEDPETNESLATIVFLMYGTKAGMRTSSQSESISRRAHESLVWWAKFFSLPFPSPGERRIRLDRPTRA